MSTYINDKNVSVDSLDGTPVRWELMAWDRLEWLYGPARADLIASGRDPKTQADVDRWMALGRRSAA